MEIRSGFGHVAQRRDAEDVLIRLTTGDFGSAEVFSTLRVCEASESLATKKHAVVASGAAGRHEQIEAFGLLRRQRVGFAFEVAVKRRAGCNKRSFERGNRFRDILERQRVFLVGEGGFEIGQVTRLAQTRSE